MNRRYCTRQPSFHNHGIMCSLRMRLASIFLLGVTFTLSGCGTSYSTTPVSGVVHYKGAPLKAGASVRFIPLRSGDTPGKAAYGEIGADGAFTLSTYAPGDGALLGEHRVEVTQKKHVSEARYEGGKESKRLVEPARVVPVADRVPSVYGGADSPLRVTVTAGMSPLVLELTSSEG